MNENEKLKIKMQNDKAKLKNEFKKRLYRFTLKLIEFLDGLPKDNVSKRLADQLLRSGTSIIANYVEGQAARKISQTFLMSRSNLLTRANCGLHCFATANVLHRRTLTGF